MNSSTTGTSSTEQQPEEMISIPRHQIDEIVSLLYEKMHTEYNNSSTMFKYQEWIEFFCKPELEMIKYLQGLL